MNKLPIGIQTFREIREEGYCYVDKTPQVARMAEESKYYFLSRPRRFGKSLLVSTLAAAFAGQRELFAGLYLENHWNWSRSPGSALSGGGWGDVDLSLVGFSTSSLFGLYETACGSRD